MNAIDSNALFTRGKGGPHHELGRGQARLRLNGQLISPVLGMSHDRHDCGSGRCEAKNKEEENSRIGKDGNVILYINKKVKQKDWGGYCRG